MIVLPYHFFDMVSARVVFVWGVIEGSIPFCECQVHQLGQQNQEMISIFKKQLMLIDTLKRQKALVEAGHLLTCTEQDFMETLDWAASKHEMSSV